MHIQQLWQNLPLHWVCRKGEKEEEIPPSFSPAVISLITSLSKGHSINKNVLLVRFMQTTLKVLYEIEALLHFFWEQKKQIPADGIESGEGTAPAPAWSQQQSWIFPPAQVNSPHFCVFAQNPSQTLQPLSHCQFLPSTLSKIGRSMGHKMVFYSLLFVLNGFNTDKSWWRLPRSSALLQESIKVCWLMLAEELPISRNFCP